MNPFNPGFGKKPEIFLDRQLLIQKVTDELENPNSPYRTSLIYGLRGSGKTAFLTDASTAVAAKKGWIVLNLAMSDSILPNLIVELYRKANSPLQKLFSQIKGVNISAFGVDFSIGSSQPSLTSYQTLFADMLDKLRSRGLDLFITIDEIDNTPAIKEFASLYQLMLRENYSLALMMTGLPHKISELQNDKILTFLLRSSRINLEPIALTSIKYSYQKSFRDAGFTVEDAALTTMARMTAGYAYAFQLLGYQIWNRAAQGAPVTPGLLEQEVPEFKMQLFHNVYTKVFHELSPKDREFLLAMAQCVSGASAVPTVPTNTGIANVRISDISGRMGKGPNYISMYRRRLLDSQIIQATGHGTVSFTLPFMSDFIIENHELYAGD